MKEIENRISLFITLLLAAGFPVFNICEQPAFFYFSLIYCLSIYRITGTDASRSQQISEICLQFFILFQKLHQLRTINRTLSPGKLLRYLFQLLGILIASSHKVSGCIQTIADMQYFNKETHI